MKLLLLFLLAGLLHVSAATNAQTITLSGKNMPLQRALDAIRMQAGYEVAADKSLLNLVKPITVHADKMPIEEFVEAILRDQPVLARIEDKTVYLFEKHLASHRIGKDIISKTTQQRTISGTVTNEQGKPLEGVTVRVKGTTVQNSTNEAGSYEINVPQTATALVFTMVGFEPFESFVAGQATIDVSLRIAVSDLDEVVIIGYGEVRREDMTGSISEVKMSDMEKAPVKSFEDALAGRVAGVQVTSADGQPGSVNNIVIRGNNSLTQDNSPLYVIDGFPIERPDNNGINPSDIQSITVLKDASATAIYGARGANGVILITTKRGKDSKPVITYDGFAGTQRNLNKQSLMDPYEFVKFQNELDPSIGEMYFTEEKPTLESYRNTLGVDWQDQIFRTAMMQNHTISLRGGNRDTRYSLSGSHLAQDGVITNSGFKRAQGRITLDQQVDKRFKLGMNANFSWFKSYGTPTATDRNYALLYNTWAYRPINSAGDLDALLEAKEDAEVITSGDYRFNPILTAENELRDRITNALQANAFGEYQFNRSLKLKVSAGMDLNLYRYDVFDNSNTRSANPNGPLGQNGVNGSVTFTQRGSFVNENTLSYYKDFNNGHKLNLLGGATLQHSKSFLYGGGAILVPNESLGLSGLDDGTPFSIQARRSQNTMSSFLGRVNYNYKSRYLLTASFRADGSSKFPQTNKWGYFPSGALAWNVGEEKFLKHIRAISEAKLRISYGLIGNNRVGDFDYYSALTLPVSASYSPNNAIIKGAIPSSLGNSNLKWETTAETDLGLDLGLLNQRIKLTVDAYTKKTTDLLLNARLPASSGYFSAFKNIGSVQNRGLEFSLTSVNLDRRRFYWSSGFNISFNRNKVLSLAEGQDELLSNLNWDVGFYSVPLFVARVGDPIAQFYGLKWAGNYQYIDFNETAPGIYVLKDEVPTNGNVRSTIEPGDIKYVDLNGDGVVDANDRTVIGNPNPKFIGGFVNDFKFGAFDLNVFLQWSFGNQIMNANRIIFEGAQSGRRNVNQFATYVDRWTPDNQNNTYFRTGGYGPDVYADRTIEDGSFLRLKTLSFGYNLPDRLSRKIGVSSARIHVSAQNLVTWSNTSSNSDPEVSTFGSALTPGFDFSAYPRTRTMVLGVNVGL